MKQLRNIASALPHGTLWHIIPFTSHEPVVECSSLKVIIKLVYTLLMLWILAFHKFALNINSRVICSSYQWSTSTYLEKKHYDTSSKWCCGCIKPCTIQVFIYIFIYPRKLSYHDNFWSWPGLEDVFTAFMESFLHTFFI